MWWRDSRANSRDTVCRGSDHARRSSMRPAAGGFDDGRSGTRATSLSSAIVASMAENTGRGAQRSRCCVEESVIACLHDSPRTGELSLARDGKEEAVLAIRRTRQESMRRAHRDRRAPERQKGGRVEERQTTSTRTSRSTRSCWTSKTPRPTINQVHPDRRPMHSADLAPDERIGESKRGLVMCRDHDASLVARGEAPLAAGPVEPTERTPPSAGSHRRGRGACPNEPGQPLPPRLVRFAQRPSATISAAHTALVRGRWGGSGSTVVRHAFVSVRLRSGTAEGAA